MVATIRANGHVPLRVWSPSINHMNKEIWLLPLCLLFRQQGSRYDEVEGGGELDVLAVALDEVYGRA